MDVKGSVFVLFGGGGYSNIPLKKLKNITRKTIHCRKSKGTDVSTARNVTD